MKHRFYYSGRYPKQVSRTYKKFIDSTDKYPVLTVSLDNDDQNKIQLIGENSDVVLYENAVVPYFKLESHFSEDDYCEFGFHIPYIDCCIDGDDREFSVYGTDVCFASINNYVLCVVDVNFTWHSVAGTEILGFLFKPAGEDSVSAKLLFDGSDFMRISDRFAENTAKYLFNMWNGVQTEAKKHIKKIEMISPNLERL